MTLCSACRGLTVPRRCWGSFWQPAVGVTEQYARDNNNDDKDPGGIMIEHAVGKERAELSLKALF